MAHKPLCQCFKEIVLIEVFEVCAAKPLQEFPNSILDSSTSTHVTSNLDLLIIVKSTLLSIVTIVGGKIVSIIIYLGNNKHLK